MKTKFDGEKKKLLKGLKTPSRTGSWMNGQADGQEGLLDMRTFGYSDDRSLKFPYPPSNHPLCLNVLSLWEHLDASVTCQKLAPNNPAQSVRFIE